MRKVFLTFVVVIISITNIFAQSTLVATLTHGTDITMYYGTTALQSAHNAAESGDVINLSGGKFDGFTITKALTIRGTGVDSALPTSLTTSTINIPGEDTNRLTMEGINFTNTITMDGTFEKPYFIKCNFLNLNFKSSSNISKATYINCKVKRFMEFPGGSKSSIQFLNGYIGYYNNTSSDSGKSIIENSILYSREYANEIEKYGNSQFINCIMIKGGYENGSVYSIPSSSSGFNCLFVNYKKDPIANSQGSFVDCMSTSSISGLFKDYPATYPDSQTFSALTFELTDEAKAAYLGIDGKEVGIYGGDYPYTSTPSYPQITKMDVSKKASADGKLNVEIEVNAAE